MTAPTIHLTNPAGLKAGKGGSGKAHLITIAPSKWLLKISDRLCLAGCPPNAGLMMAARKGRLSLHDYERVCRANWSRDWERFRPGRLSVINAFGWLDRQDRSVLGLVEDGDTLLCVCGAADPCHRRWLATVLEVQGWRVVLDGVRLGEEPPPASHPELETSGSQLGLFVRAADSAPDPSPHLEALAPVWPLRVNCWRVIETAEDALRRERYFDLPVEIPESEVRVRLCAQVVETGRAWRLYRICPAGTWSPYGLLYPHGPLRWSGGGRLEARGDRVEAHGGGLEAAGSAEAARRRVEGCGSSAEARGSGAETLRKGAEVRSLRRVA